MSGPIRDAEREKYFTDRGIKICFKWECHFDEAVKKYDRLKEMMKEFSPQFYSRHPSTVTQEQILDAVVNDRIFGLLLVNLHVPTGLKKFFDEYPPLCGKAEVTFQDIGSYMQNHFLQNDIPFKSQVMLMQTMEGENILLTNELLKWLMLHGLIVTHVEEVIESIPAYPFREFAKAVTAMRRSADRNPDEAIRASIAKLIG